MNWNKYVLLLNDHVFFNSKYEKIYLNKATKNQCQHSSEIQHNELLKLLQNSEELFYGTLGTWKIYPADFELKITRSQYAQGHI